MLRYIHRKPVKERDGTKNYGKPCVICGAGTVGEKWVQISIFRGEDETARVCSACWKVDEDIVFNAIKKPHHKGRA